MSPNYPLPYPNNLICKWSLQLEEGVTTLMMHFTDLDLQDTEDCLSNYLEIRYTEVIIKYYLNKYKYKIIYDMP